MSDHPKKGQRQKPEPKEQRKPKQGKKQEVDNNIKKEKKNNLTSSEASTKASLKLNHDQPPPEFYKNLKRETDEILKITEEASSKYKNKEILSNWAKYEMPIESYDDIQEQDVGADFEQLIQASMSVGGHFQFKHEKSWDQSTAPSLYDKYFNINSSNLATALYTIPFYERNCIEKSMFTLTDIQNMDSRTARHKHKYFNDKSFVPEAESLENIQAHLKEGLTFHDSKNRQSSQEDIVNEEEQITAHSRASDDLQSFNSLPSTLKCTEENEDINDIIFGKISPVAQCVDIIREHYLESEEKNVNTIETKGQESKSESNTKTMESTEDLEKWLDDFLDN